MTMTSSDPDLAIDRASAPGLAEAAYAAFVDLAAGVRGDQWQLPTDCEGWDVRALTGHMVGAMRSAASLREFVRQQSVAGLRARRAGSNPVDEMTALQIQQTADLSPEALLADAARLVRPAARGRARTPGLLRTGLRFPVEFSGVTERWNLGYLVDVILTRDAWLHRVDLARALGVPLHLTPELDGRIVGDVAAEWGRRHGAAVRLVLTGPAGGTFQFGGAGAPTLEVDAVEFCRRVSGRPADPTLPVRGEADAARLLETPVPF